jgi:NadR type nicotinamide-nucleotide adenylyltransferase
MEKRTKNRAGMKQTEKPAIVVITGAESTGKSVLTHQLARHFAVPSFSEYARDYVGNLNRPYTYADLESIATMQHAQMNAAISIKQPVVFFDTWLIITLVWFEVVYGKAPAWIVPAIANAPVDLFLVCNTDIPWIPDPLRENGGALRLKLQAEYIKLIDRFGFKRKLVSGHGEARLQSAIEFICADGYKL